LEEERSIEPTAGDAAGLGDPQAGPTGPVALEALPEAALLIDGDGRVVEANELAGRLFGREPAGRPLAELLDHAEMPETGGQPLRLRSQGRHGDDVPFVVDLSVTSHADLEHGRAGVRGRGRDRRRSADGPDGRARGGGRRDRLPRIGAACFMTGSELVIDGGFSFGWTGDATLSPGAPIVYNRPSTLREVRVVHWGAARTKAETIERFGELAERGEDCADVAKRWTDAGFDDETTERWLQARCFDPGAARDLADLGVTPGQASKRTRDGAGESYIDTIAYKVAMGHLSARQGAARAGSSR